MTASNPATVPGLRQNARYITGHDNTAKSVFLDSPEIFYHQRPGNSSEVGRVYTVSKVPAPLGQDSDLKAYLTTETQDIDSSATPSANGKSVTIDGGVNMVQMNMGPGAQSVMHQTVSVDLVIVVEGEVELELDSGEKKVLYQGDTVVQRATMHRWRNPSSSKPAKFIAVLISSEKFRLGDQEIKKVYLS
ncbi:hypothetical protein BDV59DRAFT_202950 [Aspergillus ambiguus]|uniref:cupin domain-containing protein n=1 Tax=Aspergillus ambiguus TaxID=176160 RepID=UPI003CCDB0FB